MKPLLKWAGGKARLAPRIAEHLGAFPGTYREPFMGSGAVFLHLRPARAVLSDANEKLIAFHVAIRDECEAVIAELGAFPTEGVWAERYYYNIRAEFNEGPHHGPAHAARFLWLNRACFNGLYRENKAGRFNVPVGRYKRLSIPTPERIREVSTALQGVEILCQPFQLAMRRAETGDAVYCDPPYMPLPGSASFTNYHRAPFGAAEHLDLVRYARVNARAGSRVAISNHDTPESRVLYQGCEIDSFEVRRSVGAKSRNSAKELIACMGGR